MAADADHQQAHEQDQADVLDGALTALATDPRAALEQQPDCGDAGVSQFRDRADSLRRSATKIVVSPGVASLSVDLS
jgi:hypothetical protein